MEADINAPVTWSHCWIRGICCDISCRPKTLADKTRKLSNQAVYVVTIHCQIASFCRKNLPRILGLHAYSYVVFDARTIVRRLSWMLYRVYTIK